MPAIEVGSQISFQYPRHNFYGVMSRLEPRRLVVTAIRDTREHPIEQQTYDLQPLLRRGSVLVIGQDPDRQAERSFYVDSMRDIKPWS